VNNSSAQSLQNQNNQSTLYVTTSSQMPAFTQGMGFYTKLFRYSFICQGTLTRSSKVTFSVFESSCHLLLPV